MGRKPVHFVNGARSCIHEIENKCSDLSQIVGSAQLASECATLFQFRSERCLTLSANLPQQPSKKQTIHEFARSELAMSGKTREPRARSRSGGSAFKPTQAPRYPMRASDALLPSLTTIPQVEHCGMRLYSAFQPIISVVHAKIVGHEALMRALSKDQSQLQPVDLFPQLQANLGPHEIHEICSKLHLQSFSHWDHQGWLFLNVNPDSISSRRYVRESFGRWLTASGLSPSRVVVEIIETRACDGRMLSESVEGFRDLGCLVAIDDFGAGESNFERVWRLRPDIIKLDRAMITEAATNPLVHRILPGLVSLVHEAGCLVVMEGIETEHQAMIAVESDVDFVQGYYFSRPGVYTGESFDIAGVFDALAASIKINAAERNAHSRGYIASFIERFRACVDTLVAGHSFEVACRDFVKQDGLQRVYELDAEGYQVGHNVESKIRGPIDDRFSPCADGCGANWYRRPYFQRAISAPGRIQVSRPYLSITDAQCCVTLSIAFEYRGKTRVLCADLDHQSQSLNPESGARYSAVIRR